MKKKTKKTLLWKYYFESSPVEFSNPKWDIQGGWQMTEQWETGHNLVDTKDGKHCHMHKTICREANVFGIFSAVFFLMASEDQLWKGMNQWVRKYRDTCKFFCNTIPCWIL